MREIGMEHSYQLEGGILKYFEEVGSAHYSGSCFVFDGREALEPDLSIAPTERTIRRKAKASSSPKKTNGFLSPVIIHITSQQRVRDYDLSY